MKDEIGEIQYIISANKLKKNLDKHKRSSNDKNYSIETKIDKDMIGIKYPEIMFNDIRQKLINNNLIFSLIEFMKQLEVKLIYL